MRAGQLIELDRPLSSQFDLALAQQRLDFVKESGKPLVILQKFGN
jgi:hypothetical protein